MTKKAAAQFDELSAVYESMARWPFRRDIEIPSVMSLIGELHNLDVLDFGCGTGMYSRRLKARDARRVVGYDLADGMLNYARRRAETEKFDIDFISELEPGLTGQFDVVLGVYVLPYAKTREELHAMCADMVSGLESLLPLAAKMPKVYGTLSQNPAAKWLQSRIGLVDVPELAPIRLDKELARQGFTPASADALAKLRPEERRKHVLIVQDGFTRYFDTQVMIDVFRLLRHLGFEPHAVPFLPNGKALQVHGFLERFERVAAKNAQQLDQFAKLGVSLVGIEPATTLTYRSEYRSTVNGIAELKVQLIQEWLVEQLAASRSRLEPTVNGDVAYRLLAHCTERANVPSAVKSWKELFSMFGASVDLVSVGCCGMAGTFGHEIEHRDQSERIYGQSWRSVVEDETKPPVLSDGFSCRCQAKRFSSRRLQHPAPALLAVVSEIGNADADAPCPREGAIFAQVAD